MKKNTVLTATLVAVLALPLHASATDERELAEIRDQIKQMKEHYEARIQSLEKRLQSVQKKSEQKQAEQKNVNTEPAITSPPAFEPTVKNAGKTGGGNDFNPAISLTLAGTYANLSKDPAQYRLQGLMTGDEIGPGTRSFSLGESELSFSGNIDHIFSGQLTFALAPDNSVGVEEAFFQANGLANGANLKGGRFLSSIGYLNNHHAHVWDFVDAPLAYQAFLGGQYKQDGLQAKWLAPTDAFVELGAEAGNGASYPGTDRNKNGANSASVFAHVGGDIGASSSWRTGISYLHTEAENRAQTELDGSDFFFSGRSKLWIADAIYKWAPNGNAKSTNFKLQGEYFRRRENGTLTQTGDTGSYSATQSGWYVQSVYQFMPGWRTGLRYDRLSSGTQEMGLDASRFPSLASYSPSKTSLMFDYSFSEFSRLRLQLAEDKSRPGVTDNEIFLQYLMSLGAHGAHSF
jgi:hypothetical protein